jgi:hypothetical protein
VRNYNPLTRSETQGIRLWLRKNKAIKKEEEALVFEALQRLAKEARRAATTKKPITSMTVTTR